MYSSISELQIKHEIDLQQAYEAFRDTQTKLAAYAGGMHWKRIGDADYLYRSKDRLGNAKSLGRRTVETEKIYSSFKLRKDELQQRNEDLMHVLSSHTAIAKALRIGTAPNIVGSICERLSQAGLMGKNIMVIGTHALHAYGALAGVRFHAEIAASEDVDLLWDPKSALSIAAHDMDDGGLLGLLKRVDASFELLENQKFRAANKNGFMVDLIKQTPNPPWLVERNQLAGQDDFVAVEIPNMNWMLSAPRIRQVVVSQNGKPFEMVVPDPRAFALFKLWLSSATERDPIKKPRDLRQAQAVIKLLDERLPQYPLDVGMLQSFPQNVSKRLSLEKSTS